MPQFSNVMQAEEFSDYLVSHLDWVYEDDLPNHPKLYNAWLPSTSGGEWREEGIVIAGLGAMPEKPVGGDFYVDKMISSDQKTFETQTWGIAVVLEYELTRHDQYAVFDGFAREMAKSAVDRCNILAYSILNNFFSTSDSRFTIYSAEALGSTTHALLGGGTTSNRAANDAALSYTSLQAGRTRFMLQQNERGRYVNLVPDCLTVHPSNEFYAQTLMKSALRPGTSNNDVNTLKGTYKVHGDSPYLTSETAWFLTATKANLRNRSMRFREIDKPMNRSDFDASTWNTVYNCYQANRVEVLHYQGTYGSEGDGS